MSKSDFLGKTNKKISWWRFSACGRRKIVTVLGWGSKYREAFKRWL